MGKHLFRALGVLVAYFVIVFLVLGLASFLLSLSPMLSMIVLFFLAAGLFYTLKYFS